MAGATLLFWFATGCKCAERLRLLNSVAVVSVEQNGAKGFEESGASARGVLRPPPPPTFAFGILAGNDLMRTSIGNVCRETSSPQFCPPPLPPRLRPTGALNLCGGRHGNRHRAAHRLACGVGGV